MAQRSQSYSRVRLILSNRNGARDACQRHESEIAVRHFDLLCAHGGSIGVVLKESDESAGALVSALEKAVTVVKGGEGAAEAKVELEAGPSEPAAALPESAPKRAQAGSLAPDSAAAEAPEPPAKIPFKVRFKAWWDGVDPADMPAGTPK